MALLTHLSLRDFRNIARGELACPADGAIVIGENGQGKTNLLEAIYYLQLLRSVRGAQDQELIRFDAPAFHIAARIVTQGAHDVSAAFERAGRRKKIRVDGAEVTRLSDALGMLPSVMVSPRDVELVSGGPHERRRFLDVVLALTSRRYLTALQSYRGALLRRNAALRETARTGRNEDAAAVWEPALAEHGALLVAERAAWVSEYAEPFSRLCHAIGERVPVTMRYETTVTPPSDARDTLLRTLEQRRAHDVRRGATQTGPHRDDLAIVLDAHDMRTYGSAGQQRTTAIALRMLEAATLRAHLGTEPVLLLDDPFAELDVRRATHILELLRGAGMGQTILAVPRPTDIPPELTALQQWHIHDGVLTPPRDGVASDGVA